MQNLRDLNLPEMEAMAAAMHHPKARGQQLFNQIFTPGINSYHQLHNIAQNFITEVSQHYTLTPLIPLQKVQSADGTTKYTFQLTDGLIIETVLIPSQQRHTLCISSQAGCAMGCRFCRTASMGLKRNLPPSEIIGQILPIMHELKNRNSIINNIVIMGMGEPLNNTKNILKAISIMQHPKGLNFANRKITISTCGITPELHTFAEHSNVNIAISLHSADDQTRTQIMPINRKYPLSELLTACRQIASPTRPILIEYILLRDINDTPDQAHKLINALKDIPCKINLIPYNPTPDLPYHPSPKTTAKTFRQIIANTGLFVRMRHSRGNDISAACGQLATNNQPNHD